MNNVVNHCLIMIQSIFILKMSRVPGYEQRLKALLFKGNFNEKITEMKEVQTIYTVVLK